MMGVVLWSDPYDQKAVFWCEDHGDLAYYDASVIAGGDFASLCAGDMVQFDVSIQRKTRRAHNARLIEQKVCNGLPDDLRKSALELNPVNSTSNVSPTMGEVVRLHANTDQIEATRIVKNG